MFISTHSYLNRYNYPTIVPRSFQIQASMVYKNISLDGRTSSVKQSLFLPVRCDSQKITTKNHP